MTAVPAALAPSVSVLEQSLRVIAAGCAMGTVKGSVLIPDADLSLSLMLDREAFPSVDLDRQTALAYLHRDTITLPAETPERLSDLPTFHTQGWSLGHGGGAWTMRALGVEPGPRGL